MLFICLLSLSGCSILGSLDGLMTLNAYSNEKSQQHLDVEKIHAQVKTLHDDLEGGRILKGMKQDDIRHTYGEPTYIRKLPEGEQWLYRYSMWHANKEKIYLDFNNQGELVEMIVEKDTP